MGKITTLEEHMFFRGLARAGHTDDEIAEQTGWSVSTVRKWRRRADQGHQALVSVMGRPATGSLSTFPSLISLPDTFALALGEVSRPSPFRSNTEVFRLGRRPSANKDEQKFTNFHE